MHCNRCGREYVKIACDFVSSKTGGCWCTEGGRQSVSYQNVADIVGDKFTVEYFDGFQTPSTGQVKLTCNECGRTFAAKVKSIFDGHFRCPSCSQKDRKPSNTVSKKEILARMKTWPSVEIDIDTYSTTNDKATFHCKNCGHSFLRKPALYFSGLIHGDPCPECNKRLISEKRTKTTNEYINDVNNVHGDGKYTVLGDYTASDKKVLVRCNDCGREFLIEANSFLQGHGCPYHNCNSSGKEKEIAEFIGTLCRDVYTNDRTVLNGKELDIYIPSKHMAFEFDGVFWHNENCKPNDYHLNKTLECEKAGIRLIHIFEDEWKHNRPVWESMIRNLLGCTENRIFARNCTVEVIEDVNEATEFLKSNHIQGWCPSQIKLGLRYNGELVSLMTFGKSRHFIGNGETEYELLRFCNKLNNLVVGGASKLFKYFLRTYNPSSIVSYADRRWSAGNLYDKLGFTFSHYSKPNYFYVIKDKRHNRFNFRKSVLVKKYGCPDNMSEREFCKMKNWYRIYDCGTAVYKWIKQN